ncbi:MAG: peptidase M4 family protein [Gammaproteobacteria bacterium]|nr:peptidase M4 family protein [Gammaproteobacteria bacterium]
MPITIALPERRQHHLMLLKKRQLLGLSKKPGVYREVYDGQKKARLPGKLVRKEGDPPVCDDDSVNIAYDGAGDIYDLFLDEYRRNSLDGKGMKLISTVHHRNKYNNAFWDGRQMAYGDGDGEVFTTMTELSVIGHELSHGVVQFSGGLIYRNQSSALNESFADVFGALTLQRKYRQSACEASWLIGEGIFGPSITGDSLRSLKAPGEAYDDELLGKDPQPYHMDLYLDILADNGGVHINSGIPNHAFYLLSQYLGGNAWEKAGHIWYDTLQSINNPNATFNQWADKTVEMARERFGSGSREAIYTRRAWLLVGIAV